MTQQQNTTVTFPVAGLLGIAFVVLKLTNVIHWSWWLVLLPFYGGTALALVFLIIAAFFIGAAGIAEEHQKKKVKSRVR